MKSLLEERLGAQQPVILHQPPNVASLVAAEEAIELADAYRICDGNPLAESQKITLRAALGERADGSWAATRVADFGPRQGTGKNDKIAARELAGLILFGERLIIHTAHEAATATEAFVRLVAVFEAWDDLRKKVRHIYYANGAQAIELMTGQRLLYKARTGGSGRGFAKADLVVYDEAQHVHLEHLAASGPAKLANPNSQSWYAGSGGFATSDVAWAIRRAAILGEGGRLAYTEATAESITVADGRILTTAPDPSDLDAWYRAMPGLGRWVTEELMQATFEELGPEKFARECLCVWDPESSAGSVITAAQWKGLEDKRSHRVGAVAFAIDVTPDQKWASIAACGVRADGLLHVELVKHQPGTDWVPEEMARLRKQHDPLGVWIDHTGPAGGLVPLLEKAGVPLRTAGDKGPGFLEKASGTEYAAACALFLEHVIHEGFRHVGQPQLASAVDAAISSPKGDGGWAWSRKSSLIDISPLVAATLALWGFNARRNELPASGFVDLGDFLDDDE